MREDDPVARGLPWHARLLAGQVAAVAEPHSARRHGPLRPGTATRPPCPAGPRRRRRALRPCPACRRRPAPSPAPTAAAPWPRSGKNLFGSGVMQYMHAPTIIFPFAPLKRLVYGSIEQVVILGLGHASTDLSLSGRVLVLVLI